LGGANEIDLLSSEGGKKKKKRMMALIYNSI